MASPVVRAYLNQLASGDPKVDWLTWAWGRFVRGRGLRVLVLGCGGGWLERSLAGRPEIASIDACDVAEGAVAQAAATARELGLGHLRYHVVDLNEDALPAPPGPPEAGGYDVVIAHSVLHHVENLEHAYREIAARLRPGGLLLINEYVGPRRFQYGERQIELINGVLTRLPEGLRRSALDGGTLVPWKPVPRLDFVVTTDPSEAVRSDDVLALARAAFDVECEIDYGGTLLQHLLFDLVHNFDPADPADRSLLAAACFLEAALIREGAVGADFALLVARRRVGEGAEEGRQEERRLRRPPRALRGWELAVAGPDKGAIPPARFRLTAHTRPVRDRRHGVELAPVRELIHRLATDDPACDWIGWVLHHRRDELAAAGGPTLVFDPPGGWLAERVAAAAAAFPALGPVVVTAAEGPAALAAAAGVPAGAYGRVFLNGRLGRLDRWSDRLLLAERLAGALRPGGWLIGDDYIGRPDGRPAPSTLDYARELCELIQPAGVGPPGAGERLRARLSAAVNRLLVRNRPSPGEGGGGSPERGGDREPFAPPEAVLGALLGRDFRLERVRPTGGALLQRVLAGAAGRFAPADDKDLALLRLLVYTEELLTAAGAVPHDYACFLARRR